MRLFASSKLACVAAVFSLGLFGWGLQACGDSASSDDGTSSVDGGAVTEDGAIVVVDGSIVRPDGSVDPRGPAYTTGAAACPASDGHRHVRLANNCDKTRWIKFDTRTTPLWARPTTCAWAGTTCTDVNSAVQCTAAAKAKSAESDPGAVYCVASAAGGGAGECGCHPYFKLEAGASHEIDLPDGSGFASGTAWFAEGCDERGMNCQVGEFQSHNGAIEFTYDDLNVKPGGSLFYDITAVDGWSTASNVGMKSCGGEKDPSKPLSCAAGSCTLDIAKQCPDGSDAFPAAPNGCVVCPTITKDGQQVINGSCGPCPNGASANQIPTGTVFNAKNVGGDEWTWTGAPDFATSFGFDEGVHAQHRYTCTNNVCTKGGAQPNSCLSGCDICVQQTGKLPHDPECIKYCCPDTTIDYGGHSYRYDSAGCTALGVQRGTDYTASVKAACPLVYTYGYEDNTSTFTCQTSASLLVVACPDTTDFPSKL